MADNGKFDGSVELKLVKCSSLPPFSETSNFEGLNAYYSCIKEVPTPENTENKATACFEITNSCTQQLKMLILRPVSALWQPPPPPKDPLKEVPKEWRDIDVPDFTRDILAGLLTVTKDVAKAEKGVAKAEEVAVTIALGRPQFYYDGMVELLLGTQKTGCSKFNLKLGSYTNEKNGKLLAVTVQIITAYAPVIEKPAGSAVKPATDCDKTDVDDEKSE